MGQQTRRSRVLESKDEQVAVAFRQRSKLPLDECLNYMRRRVPQLTRSTLYRCFLRHGLSRIADCAGGMSDRELCDIISADNERISREILGDDDILIVGHNLIFGTRL
jgi:hypothetical protein